ncbi:diaminopimelate epimerase [unidentified eubacterium SCB49]|nr:diaminopimelate epimerase [unidentified eubacterium SCB49]
MKQNFYKYQGTGNDFVIIDNRELTFPKKDTKLIALMCDRKFGVGADGLILLENDATLDFKMVYYNADGNESSMCGNGGRCIVDFAKQIGVINSATTFQAIDGPHEAVVKADGVSLKMIDVDDVNVLENYMFLNTGSPHHVQLVENLKNFEVFTQGKEIRNSIYGDEGANVNFVEQESEDTFKVRTYERGVEDETLSCGTGVTAVAIALHKTNKLKENQVNLMTEGGLLQVKFDFTDGVYSNVFLEGPATLVFKGVWE